jgi:hypothetical protein
MSQPWILADERSGLQTHIAMTESGSAQAELTLSPVFALQNCVKV